MKRLAALALILLAISSCGPKSHLQRQLRKLAPTGPQDVGVIVEQTKESEIENFISRYPEAKVRILNREHGMYEIFGLSTEIVKTSLSPSAKANAFFYLKAQNKIHSFASKDPPEGLKLPGLKKCQKGPDAPTAKLQMITPSNLVNEGSLEFGNKIKFSSRGSTANPNSPSELKRALVVLAPSSASTPETITNTDELEYVPDGLGAYQAFVVVQDAKQVCAMDSLLFVVTANPAFSGNKTSELNIDLGQFPHLLTLQAQEAWRLSEGQNVLIAIIDTGVNYNHPTLAPNISLNTQEIEGNGIDDDKNGFVDDMIGYDFVGGDALPFDDDGHGTHVAGLAASTHFGVARKAKLLPLKALTSVGGDVGTISAAIRYAVDRGARVINLSLGAASEEAPPLIKEAIDYAQGKGAIVVAAAGNGDPFTGLGLDIDENKIYPASLENENLITVGASEDSSPLATYSNFGKNSVEVIAPGGHMPTDPVYSAAMQNRKGDLLAAMSGTSMATPLVAGIIANMISINPSLDAKSIRNILLESGPLVDDLKNICVSGRIISAYSAVRLASPKNVLF